MAILTLIAVAGPASAADNKTRTWKANKHVAGLTYEVWRAHSVGLRYMHTHEHGAVQGGYYGGMSWLSYGVRPRLILTRGEGLAAAGGDLAGAISLFGHTGGVAAELAVGGLFGDATVVTGSPGIFWSMMYFDIGYVYQFPMPGIDRPTWLASHQFALRINIPFYEYGREETVTGEPAAGQKPRSASPNAMFR